MTTKPSVHPDWTTGDPSQVEAPTPTQQASGFTANQRPTYQLLNWLFYINGEWTEYFDSVISGNASYTANNPQIRMVGGGKWTYNASNSSLSWSDTITVGIPGQADTANQIAAGSVTLMPGQVAYVEANTSGSSAQLTPQVTTSQNLSPDLNTIIFARGLQFDSYSSTAMVGVNAGQMLVRDGEQKALLGSGYDGVEKMVAGQALTAGQAVYLSAETNGTRTPGSVYPADSSSTNGAARGKVIGFVMSSCAAGAQAHIVRAGVVQGLRNLTAGVAYYLDPANVGALTSTIPTAVGTFVVPVGVALSATSLRFNAAAAEIAAAVPNGLTVNGPLVVNGQVTVKPGQTGNTFSLYDATGKTLTGTLDSTGLLTLANALVTGNVTATGTTTTQSLAGSAGSAQAQYIALQNNLVATSSSGVAVSVPYVTAQGSLTSLGTITSAVGFRRAIYMGGYYTSNFPGASMPFVINNNGKDNQRYVTMAVAGSVLSVSASFTPALPSGSAVSIALQNNGLTLINANLNINGNRTGGSYTMSKGQYKFNGNDVITAYINYSSTGISTSAECDITVETDA